MENNLIQIEKGKYTTLLRRVLGMQVSENGVSELEAIFTKIRTSARHAQSSTNTMVDVASCVEDIEFALEYYNLRKEEIWPEQTIVREHKPEDCF